MKKILLFVALILFSISSFAQDKLYLIFEMMKVDNEQEMAYWETENFWEKIHQQRANNGDIIGWDLWQLLPGGSDQGYQYMTVTLFNNASDMFKGVDIMKYAKAAYPDMTEDDILKKLNEAGKTRDLSVRLFLEDIASTSGANEMPIGTTAYLDFMKADMDKYDTYEKAEMEVFKPIHQKHVDTGDKKFWSLMRIMLPIGSDTYASHITVNMYKDVDAAINQPGGNWGDMTDVQRKAIQDGLKTRDFKKGIMAILIKKARKN